MTITDTLRHAAKTCGMTQQELARASGVQESVVSRFLAGAGLRSGNMDALAKTLGLELTKRTEGAAGDGGTKPRKPASATTRRTKGGR
jgi:DNA transposition AAA+ family ATPase